MRPNPPLRPLIRAIEGLDQGGIDGVGREHLPSVVEHAQEAGGGGLHLAGVEGVHLGVGLREEVLKGRGEFIVGHGGSLDVELDLVNAGLNSAFNPIHSREEVRAEAKRKLVSANDVIQLCWRVVRVVLAIEGVESSVCRYG
jgi:hypothetical protein